MLNIYAAGKEIYPLSLSKKAKNKHQKQKVASQSHT